MTSPRSFVAVFLILALAGCSYIGEVSSPSPSPSPIASPIGVLPASATPSLAHETPNDLPAPTSTLDATADPGNTPLLVTTPTPTPIPTPTATPSDPPATPIEPREAWQRIPDFPPKDAEVYFLSEASFGFVAAGTLPMTGGRCEYGGDDGGIWTSADGTVWSQTVLPQVYIENLVVAGESAYVFGSGGNYCDEGDKGGIWRSENGTDWQRVSGELAGGDEEISGLGAVGDTLIALGDGYRDDGYSYGIVWTSTDGANWQRSVNGPPPSIVGYDLVASGDLIVA